MFHGLPLSMVGEVVEEMAIDEPLRRVVFLLIQDREPLLKYPVTLGPRRIDHWQYNQTNKSILEQVVDLLMEQQMLLSPLKTTRHH